MTILQHSGQLGKDSVGPLETRSPPAAARSWGIPSAHLLNVDKLRLVDLSDSDVVLGCDGKPSLGERAESYTALPYLSAS